MLQCNLKALNGIASSFRELIFFAARYVEKALQFNAENLLYW